MNVEWIKFAYLYFIMNTKEEILKEVIIKFAGDSGDGMQLTGTQFSNNTALLGLDLATFPDFPAEIRAPQGTIPGVSGFQLRFSGDRIFTPGDSCDVLIAMNAAALKTNLKAIKPGGKIIVNEDGFDAKNLRLANYPEGINPLENNSLEGYEVIRMDVSKMTREALDHAEGADYQIGAGVIMPNHIHLLVRPLNAHSLEKILQSRKRRIAREVNSRSGILGRLWQEESFDRIVRDAEHLWRCLQYIGRNHSKAGLVGDKTTRWVNEAWIEAGWGFSE